EALERQTATADVRSVINSSAGDLAPVFDAILKKAHALCGAEYGSLQIYDGTFVRAVAARGFRSEFADRLRQGYPAAGALTMEPLLAGERFVQIADAATSDFPMMRAAAELEGLHTILFMPLRMEGRLLGFVASGRRE